MPLNKPQLKTAIKTAFKSQQEKKSNPDDALDDLAEKIADAVEVFVKQATITYSAGLVAPSGGGPVTGVFNSTIS